MFAVATMVKDEAPRMKEWLAHYVKQGCSHFFIVDNGSTDDLRSVLAGWPVTLIQDPRRLTNTQSFMLTTHVMPRLGQYEWVLVCDADEYLYAEGTVAAALKELRPDVRRVWVPWKIFGSNGWKEQPATIVKSFTKRAAQASLPYERTRAGYVSHLGLGKSISRTKGLRWMTPHEVTHDPPSMLFMSDGTPAHLATRAHMGKLRLNHYMLQSEAYYRTVKCVRGGGESGKVAKYTMAYFYEEDQRCNEVEDVELAA